MTKKTKFAKRIKRENGNDIVEITSNGKCFSMTCDKSGNMAVSLEYTSEDKTDIYQDYFEIEEGSRISKAIDDAFKYSKDDMIFFDSADGHFVLSRQDGSYRFIFMKEFYEGAKKINIKLAGDEDSHENEMMNYFFGSLAKKETRKITISSDDSELVIGKPESHALTFCIRNKTGEEPIGAARFVIEKGDILYDKLINSFMSFGGFVKFDMCNGSLELNQRFYKKNENDKEEWSEFIFSYERWQNNDPSNSKDFCTILYDNTEANRAMLHFFDSVTGSKFSHKVDESKATSFRYKKAKRVNVA